MHRSHSQVALRFHPDANLNMSSISNLKYRPDIDGLRAIAVLSVVGFHAFPDWVRGGFIGVDIFFVISGFLISNIIFSALQKGIFSFGEFYSRRIRRIFPALILVIGASYVAGWFVLAQYDYGALGKDVVAAALFVSNLLFWSKANYWNANVETQPLLHLWSLGVEEQFYILWPLILFFLWKRNSVLAWSVAAIVGLSFVSNVSLVGAFPGAVFYFPVTRFWELAAGALLAWISMRKRKVSENPPSGIERGTVFRFQNDAKSIVGLAIIGIALLIIDNEKIFPGWWALLPVAGALLIISAGPSALLNRLLLSHRAIVWVGLISYPLYLWHWPLFAFEFYVLDPRGNSTQNALLVVFASVALAALTYRFIEIPIRFGALRSANPIFLVFLLMALGVVGATTYLFEGFAAREVNSSAKAMYLASQRSLFTSKEEMDARRDECSFWSTWEPREIPQDCIAPGSIGTWFLWGDSFAQSLSEGLRSTLPQGHRLAQVTTGACRLGVANGKCDQSNTFVLNQIRMLRPQIVILAVRDGYESVNWEEIAGQILGFGAKKVFLIGPAPMWLPSLPTVVANFYGEPSPDYVNIGLSKNIFVTDRYLKNKYGTSTNLTYVSLLDRLCGGNGCLALVPGTSYPTTFDYGHLSVEGSKFVSREIISSKME